MHPTFYRTCKCLMKKMLTQETEPSDNSPGDTNIGQVQELLRSMAHEMVAYLVLQDRTVSIEGIERRRLRRHHKTLSRPRQRCRHVVRYDVVFVRDAEPPLLQFWRDIALKIGT